MTLPTDFVVFGPYPEIVRAYLGQVLAARSLPVLSHYHAGTETIEAADGRQWYVGALHTQTTPRMNAAHDVRARYWDHVPEE